MSASPFRFPTQEAAPNASKAELRALRVALGLQCWPWAVSAHAPAFVSCSANQVGLSAPQRNRCIRVRMSLSGPATLFLKPHKALQPFPRFVAFDLLGIGARARCVGGFCSNFFFQRNGRRRPDVVSFPHPGPSLGSSKAGRAGGACWCGRADFVFGERAG
jgi:hypothetical protein